MQRLFNIIAQTPGPDSTAGASEQAHTFSDPFSVILLTAGLCICIVWLFWYDGFASLQNSPARRCRRSFLFWPVPILICWLAMMIAVESMASSDAQSYPLNAAGEIVLIAAMILIARRSIARGLKGFGVEKKNIIRDIPWSAVNLAAVFPFIILGLWLTLALGKLFKGSEFNLETHQSLETLSGSGAGLQVLIVVFAALIVPVFEELLFRGFFQTSIRALSGKPWVGIVLTSLFFATLHPPTHIPALFVLSCGLGYAYERSGSLFRPILMHVLFNAISLLMTLIAPQ